MHSPAVALIRARGAPLEALERVQALEAQGESLKAWMAACAAVDALGGA